MRNSTKCRNEDFNCNERPNTFNNKGSNKILQYKWTNARKLIIHVHVLNAQLYSTHLRRERLLLVFSSHPIQPNSAHEVEKHLCREATRGKGREYFCIIHFCILVHGFESLQREPFLYLLYLSLDFAQL